MCGNCYTVAAMKSVFYILLWLTLLNAPVQASQQGMIVRQATVYADATGASASVGKVQAGARVAIFSRKGGWSEIFSEHQNLIGWVRVYQVREGDFSASAATTEKEDSRGFLAGLASFSRKASGFFTQDGAATSSGTATIGVRGLSEAEINSAQADFEELKKMMGFASNAERMPRFTANGELKASKIPYLPEPE
jgi:hypothetical protein